MTLAAAVLRKLQRKSMIFPDASRTGDNNTNGTPEEDNTDSKRRSRSLTQLLGARTLDEHRGLARADVGDAEFALGGFARRREMHRQRAQHFAVTADQRRRMHRAHAFVAGQLAQWRESRIALRVFDDHARARDARHRARTHAAFAQVFERRGTEAETGGDGERVALPIEDGDEPLVRAMHARKRVQDQPQLIGQHRDRSQRRD